LGNKVVMSPMNQDSVMYPDILVDRELVSFDGR